VFLGINGTGKTTSIAKIAYRLKRRGYKVVLAASDTYRAGAIEQLKEHARKLGVDFVSQKYGADPAAVARDAVDHAISKGLDVVLVDTAGRMHTKRNLMEELDKIIRVSEANERIVVIDALAGNDSVIQALEFDKHVGVDSIFMAKMDADVKGGTLISVAYMLGKPVRYIGVGQSYEDLKEFRLEWVIRNLLPQG
jgi:fused signal recognition particle receptor